MARRRFLAAAAAAAATIATAGLAGCIPGGKDSTGPGQNGAEQQGTSDIKLENLVSIIDGLNGLNAKLSSYSAQVLAIGGTAEQNQNISDYVGKLGEAREAVAALEENAEGMGSLDTQIDRLLSDGSADNDPPYTNADDFLRALTELTDLGKANRSLALGQHNLKTVIVEKGDNGSEALLLAADKAKADPGYKGDHIDTPDYSGGKKNLGWDLQRAIEKGSAYNGLVSFADPNHADPNSADTPKYSIDVPEGEDPEEFMGKVKVEKYVPIEGGEWGQTDAVGTVIDFGRVNIREDDIESGTQMYVFDKPDMMPPEFAASITTTPFFANQSYGNTGKDRFNDFWVKSIDEELWVNATWGNRPNVGYDNAGENVGDFTSVENKNRTIDSTQFPAEYESDCWFGAQAFNRLNVSDKSVFTTYTFVNGGSLQGIIPNLNDPLVRKSLMHYSDTLNLKIN